MTYYKVVRVIPTDIGEFAKVSSIAIGKARVEYVPNQWAYAPAWLEEEGHGLTVFEDLNSAIAFYRVECSWSMRSEIWECEVETEFLVPKYCKLSGLRDGCIIPEKSEVNDVKLDLWPDGTRVFERVKLTKRVPTDTIKEYLPYEVD